MIKIPYSVSNPPGPVKNQTKGVIRIWVNAFNSAYKAAKKRGASNEEADKSGRTAGWSAVKAKYKRIKRNGKVKYVPKKVLIPLKKEGYAPEDELPLDVQELPSLISELWREIYNKCVKANSEEKAKDVAWKSIKRIYYLSDDGTWRLKMKTLSGFADQPGTFETSFLCKVSKNREGAYYIEGKASDTSIDQEDDQMSSGFIQKMIETAVGLNMYVDHDHNLERTVGVVVESGGNANNFLVKGRLEQPYDPETEKGNKLVSTIIEKSEAGIHLAFSIGGRIIKAVKKYNEELGRDVRKIVEGILCEISVTTLPALATSAAEVSFSKSLSNALDAMEEDGSMEIDEGNFQRGLSKILDEVFVEDEIQEEIYRLTWTFMSFVRRIVSSDATGAKKKSNINEVSEEYADKIEDLSDALAEAVQEQVDFLEDNEAA